MPPLGIVASCPGAMFQFDPFSDAPSAWLSDSLIRFKDQVPLRPLRKGNVVVFSELDNYFKQTNRSSSLPQAGWSSPDASCVA